MSESSLAARVVLTTVASLEEATNVGHALVEERLAACATIIPAVNSIYRWEGKVTSAPEIMVLLKTSADLVPALEARLHELHSYEMPEFLALPIEAGSGAYLDWLKESLRPA